MAQTAAISSDQAMIKWGLGWRLGLVLAIVCLIGRPPPASPEVRPTCGVAACETITARDILINCGLTEQQIRKLFEEYAKSEGPVAAELVKVSKQLGVKEQAIKGFLETIKREQVPDEKLTET